MYKMQTKDEVIRNLDRILINGASSNCSSRRSSQASTSFRRCSDVSSISVCSTRSPLPLNISEKEWFLNSSQCQMGKLKDLFAANSGFIDKKDFVMGYTALHWAAKEGKSELLHWLCDSGADVNIKTNGGYTPLHIAVMHCKALIVDILITDYDADINARDYSGKKPGHYAQSDMPTWVQRALRTNQNTSDGAKVDALVMATTANLTAMSKQSVSRSWNSFRHENLEEKMAADKKERENPSKSRTKSILRSFRKVRNKDRANHQKDSREHSSKARDTEARERQRSDERSKSVPDICLTPASRSKLLQIEHPHFDETRQSSNEEVIDVERASKCSESGRSSSDIDDVFVFHPAKTDTGKPERTSIGNAVRKNDGDDVISPVDHKEEVEPAGLWASELLKDFGVEKKLGKDEYTNTFADNNANQWKATTVV